MRCPLCLCLALAAFALALPARGADVLVEAESFDSRGGWVVDPQFVDLMGSSYLLAHGRGVPVANATTAVTLPEAGTYRVWVRTKDWIPSFTGPGTFQVAIDGTPLAIEFGDDTTEWGWQDGGTVAIASTSIALSLVDQTGFEGRCDAIYLTTDTAAAAPTNDLAAMKPWRRTLAGLPATPPVEGSFDLVVVGGGIAGCCAAIAAARLDVSVALIHDRPYYGGNASQEVRINMLGETDRIVSEIKTSFSNGSSSAVTYDTQRQAVIDAEANISQYLKWRAFDVVTEGTRITAVDARHIETGVEKRFLARWVVDSTGDGWIGYWAGATYSTGREATATYGESLAPAAADNMKMGSSLLFNSTDTGVAQSFPAVPWATDVALDYTATAGEWFWEYGIHPSLDTIYDAEDIRDHLFRAIYGAYYNAMQLPANANRALAFVAYISGKRESRRLIGDYILTENDVRTPPGFADAVAHESRDIDIHFQKAGAYDFISEAHYTNIGQFWIPFRCLYSADVDNLMMAGRCFSASHVDLGSPRVMNTGGQMGVAVGSAAYVCKVYDTDPRGVYEDHLAELLAVNEQGADGTCAVTQVAVVDNLDAGSVQATGTWISSTYEPGYWGTDYVHNGNSADKTMSFRFIPTIPTAGTYRVYFRYAASTNRATNVPIDVTYDGGMETVTVDETVNGSQWVLLGAWSFAAGTTGNVLVRTTGTTNYVTVDAIMIASAVVADPVLSPAAGTYADSVTVDAGCFSLGADIRYTTNGTTPTEASPLWTAPLTLTADTTVTVKAFMAATEPSTAVSAAYAIAYTPTLALADATSGSTSLTNATTVSATIGSDAAAVAWIVSETQATQPLAGDTAWAAVEPTSYTFASATNELKTVYVWVKNAAGTVNVGPVSATITLDTSVPADPTLALADSTSSSTTVTDATTVNVTVGNDASAVAWIVSEAQTTQPLEGSASWTTTQPTSYTFASATNELKTVYVWVKNAAGTVNVGSVSATITLDIPPATTGGGGGCAAGAGSVPAPLALLLVLAAAALHGRLRRAAA